MIKVNDLSFSYGSHEVLSGITMELEQGRIYGLLGENGVGKTTLLDLLAGLKKSGNGSILADGEEPYRRSPSFLSRIYYLPDEVAPVNSKAIKWANVSGTFWPGYREEVFTAVLESFEVDKEMKMNKMSAGQLKKTYVSFALATGASYLLMDEPTNGLDIPGKTQFRTAIMRYTSETSTIVISTHQVRDLESIIDPIIILDTKSVLMNASVEQITSKLEFDYGTILRQDALYAEQTPAGFIQVCPNASGSESKVNIEALFNTVMKHKDLFRNE